MGLFYSFTAPLYEKTLDFTILTGSWIGLGGVFQFGVVIYLTWGWMPGDPFKSFPHPIRVLVLITAPILLSPAIVSLYGAYISFAYKMKEEAIEKIRAVFLILNVAEVILETVPQLATQMMAVATLMWEE